MEKAKEDLCELAREALEHRIRPQDEVMAVKRIMAHHLAQSLGTEQLSSPLSLVDADTTVTPSDKLQGSQRAYIEAVQRNLQAREEFAKLQSELAAAVPAAPVPSEEDDPETELLELQLEVNRLEQERDRLKVINKHLDALGEQPAASPDFLKPEVMFRGCEPLPEMPRELMDGFTREGEGDGRDREVQELLSRLQKAVLRNKLLAKREKQKLDDLRARQPIDPTSLPPEAQLHTLNAVKDHLINWIENMLSKAGDGDGEGESELGGESPSKSRKTGAAATGDQKVDHAAQIAEIQKEYERHVELRRQIMTSMAQLKQLERERPHGDDDDDKSKKKQKQYPGAEEASAPVSAARAEPTVYLLTPYLERLQAISREQKGLIQEKAHINAILTRQHQETTKVLDHLADESQLLSRYPPAAAGGTTKTADSNSGRRGKPRISFGEATRAASSAAANRPNVTALVEPWLFAAESAKIATLEAVAEKVEEGQMAVEEAMQSLSEVRKLLNREDEEKAEPRGEGGSEEGEAPPEEEDDDDDDLWLAGDNDGGGGKGAVRKNTEKKKDKKKTPPEKEERKSIWSKLDGNLGLINE
ncbi:hypothetical protein F5X96DRAFT_105138 [Biscogniauxia mediterranea]|nr:hypothetical protein F5X96DRAFT_105138 [Biscogniauxia mediterranea]